MSILPDFTKKPTNDLSTELAHVNQEMYKKNLELSERNKALSLLRTIDQITLSSVTNVNQIAQDVVAAIVTEPSFKLAMVLLVDKKRGVLKCLAVSQTEPLARTAVLLHKSLYDIAISLKESDNLLIKSVDQKKIQTTTSVVDILKPRFTPQEAEIIQQVLGITTCHVNPLIVRDEVIGAIIFGIQEQDQILSQYQKDLIDRLSQTVGIAVDNALLYQSIQEANVKLQALDKLKDEFISVASHELRTPMAAIKSYLWMVINKEALLDNDKRKIYLDRAYNSTNRLIDLVNDMLNVSRIESGRIVLNNANISIIAIAKEVCEELGQKAIEGKLTIKVVESQVPDVFADPDKIREVFFNLVGNALKFTPEGGQITVRCEENNGMIETSVSDTGKGIKKEDLSKLFKKFERLENTFVSVAKTEGTGLGLYICKQFIELSHGKIWAQSEVGKGTTFTFSLPIAKDLPVEKNFPRYGIKTASIATPIPLLPAVSS